MKTKNRKILIDANVLLYCGDKGLAVKAKRLLRTLADNGNDLATSDICCFEVIKNARPKLRPYYLKLIDYIDKVAVTSDILLNACRLRWWYGKDVGSMDLVIGGTVLYNAGTLLLTANRKHFPMPFWKTVELCYIVGKKEKEEGNRLVDIYLLEFDESAMPKPKKGKGVTAEW